VIKNFRVCSPRYKSIDKRSVHQLLFLLKKEFRFEIDALELNFVDAETIRSINDKYLNHDVSTDIITFNYSDKKLTLNSEIFISLDDAERNSKRYKVSLGNELLRLIIHGILHLLDFDDTTESSRKIMKKAEDRLVKKFQYISPKIIKA
jgi:rRNA maturation RNase YbeY